MEKEFLKLENKLILKLEIEPISPLIIKMGGKNGDKDEEDTDSSIISFMTTETTRLPKELNGIEIKGFKDLIEYNEDNGKLEDDNRIGEPFILGSTLRGLFREKFNQIYDYRNENESPRINQKDEKVEQIKYEKVENLFGFVKDDTSKKGRIFLDDAYLSNESYRNDFYSKNKEKVLDLKRKIIKTRSITPIDAFTGKAIVPLTVEYIDEKFFTTLTVNNITKEELQNIYFVIRDSHLGEIRIGSSKTRGFGEIKLNVKELIFENYSSKIKSKINNGNDTIFIEQLKNNFFEKPNEKKSIKLEEKYLMEYLELKEEYREIDIKSPNQFIKALFSEVKK